MENFNILEAERKIIKIQQANSLIDFVNVALVEGTSGRFDDMDIDNALSGISELIGVAARELMDMIFDKNNEINEK